MPVEKLAGFIAEEALGIVIGGAALVAVPFVLPALRSLGKDARPAVRTMVIAPAAKTGSVISEKVADGANWYGEQWGDLMAEVQVARAAGHVDTMTLAGLLAILPASQVLSNAPGRARLKVLPLKGRADRSVFITDAVSTMPGVLRVTASPDTCTVLIHYDTMCYVSLDSLLNWIVAG